MFPTTAAEEVESPPNVSVPEVVIVPPKIGKVVAIEVTVPVFEVYPALVFSDSVHASVQSCEAPTVLTPRGKFPAEQLAPSAAKEPAVPLHAPEVSSVRAELEPPTFATGLDNESGEEAVSVVVATVPSNAGVAVSVVQKDRLPMTGTEEVETLPEPPEAVEEIVICL